MEKSTITLTRRIQLLLDVSSDEKKAMWEKLYRYQNRCYRAANFIVSHLYVQEMMKDFFYFTEDIQYKLADINKDEMGIFNRSKTNTTARMVFDKFKGEIPTDILGSLNNSIQSVFSKEKAKTIFAKNYEKCKKSTVYFKLGVYKPHWWSRTTDVRERVYYYDNVKISK